MKHWIKALTAWKAVQSTWCLPDTFTIRIPSKGIKIGDDKLQGRGIFSKQIETICLMFFICSEIFFIFKQIFFPIL